MPRFPWKLRLKQSFNFKFTGNFRAAERGEEDEAGWEKPSKRHC